MVWSKRIFSLLETLADSIDGYDHVGENSHYFDFYAFCEHHADERRKLFRELRRALKARGLDHETHGTILGSAHRLFIDLRTALSSGNLAIIEELLRGEEFLAARADAFLEEEGLPPEIYELGRLTRTNITLSLRDLRAMQDHARLGWAAATFQRAHIVRR